MAATQCHGLESHGLSCWIAPRDITTGQRWGASIVQALDECPVMVLVLTAQANASRQIVREVECADGKQARVITFRIDDVALSPSLEYFLSAHHCFDAISPPLSSHIPALADAVRALRPLPLAAAAALPLASPPQARPAPLNDRERVKSFDDLAPGDWNSRPVARGRPGRFLRGLLDER